MYSSLAANLAFAYYVALHVPVWPFKPVCIDLNNEFVIFEGPVSDRFGKAMRRAFVVGGNPIRLDGNRAYLTRDFIDFLTGDRYFFYSATSAYVRRMMEEDAGLPENSLGRDLGPGPGCGTVRKYALEH